MAITDDLVWYLRLDESAGANNAIDSVAADNFTQHSSPGATTGKVNGCRTFNGSTQYFDHANDANHRCNGNAFTWAGWVYITSYVALQYIFYNGELLLRFGDELFLPTPKEQIEGFITDGGSYAGVNCTTFGNLSLNTWYYVVFKWDKAGGQVIIKINDVADTATDSSLTPGGTTTSTLGGVGALALLTGRVDACGYWQRLRDDAEDTSEYNAGAGNDLYPDVTSGQPAAKRMGGVPNQRPYRTRPHTKATAGIRYTPRLPLLPIGVRQTVKRSNYF